MNVSFPSRKIILMDPKLLEPMGAVTLENFFREIRAGLSPHQEMVVEREIEMKINGNGVVRANLGELNLDVILDLPRAKHGS